MRDERGGRDEKCGDGCRVSETNLVDKYLPLIKWASMKYSNRVGNTQFFSRFLDRGIDTLCICFYKWNNNENFKKRFKSEEGLKEFGKYFKTALFTNFLQLQIDINTKSKFVTLSLDDMLDSKNLLPYRSQLNEKISHDGFSEVKYKELLAEVESALKGLELKLFKILVDPPQRLNLLVLRDNAKKMRHYQLTGEKIKGLDSVRMTKTHLLKYLNMDGNRVSYSEFKQSMQTVEKTVRLAVYGN